MDIASLAIESTGSASAFDAMQTSNTQEDLTEDFEAPAAVREMQEILNPQVRVEAEIIREAANALERLTRMLSRLSICTARMPAGEVRELQRMIDNLLARFTTLNGALYGVGKKQDKLFFVYVARLTAVVNEIKRQRLQQASAQASGVPLQLE